MHLAVIRTMKQKTDNDGGYFSVLVSNRRIVAN